MARTARAPSPKAHLCEYGYTILKNALIYIDSTAEKKGQFLDVGELVELLVVAIGGILKY